MDNKDLTVLTDELKDETLLNKILEIEKLSREIHVGNMSSFQKQRFVLNPTEFVPGTVEKSRQSIFEASVRISNLRGGVYDFHKAQAEIKIQTAKKLRSEKKLATAIDEADQLEAAGEISLAEIEIQRKQDELEALKYRAGAWLDDIKDFYVSFLQNEALLKERGVSVLNWNDESEQLRYWHATTEAKLNKQLAYELAGRSQQQGDSICFQNEPNIMMAYAKSIFPLLPDNKKNEIRQLANNLGITIDEIPASIEDKKDGIVPRAEK
jgi:hypothetical protein